MQYAATNTAQPNAYVQQPASGVPQQQYAGQQTNAAGYAGFPKQGSTYTQRAYQVYQKQHF
jgi:hypothetical protein